MTESPVLKTQETAIAVVSAVDCVGCRAFPGLASHHQLPYDVVESAVSIRPLERCMTRVSWGNGAADRPPPCRYILFHKPYNVLCQFTDESAPASEPSPTRLTLKDYIPVPDVYPVGRLDQDSEGLMLLTNDGGLQHRLSDPKFEHPRTYWVQVERIPDEAALQQLRSGVTIKGYRTRPAQVHCLDLEPSLPPRDPPIRFRKNVPTAWLELTLTEGRNRQVRRMTASVGFPTLRLVRVGIGDLRLTELASGEWRELTGEELSQLRASLRGANRR